MSCRVESCEAEETAAQGYCETHYRRLLRGGDLAAPKQERLSPRARAVEAAKELMDADSEDDAAYAALEENFARAVSRWRDPLVLRERARRAGKARAASLTPERRQEIARMGAAARAVKLGPEARRRIAVKARSAHKARKRLACKQASVSPPAGEAQ